ncbi:MAG: tetratricopeptide repeat protein [Geminicoccaceae bacterium]
MASCQWSAESSRASEGNSPAENTPAQPSEPASDQLTDLNKTTADLLDKERYYGALRSGERAYRLGLETVGELHPDTLLAAHQLARSYRHVGRFDEAEILFGETLERRRAVFGERDGETLKTLYYLAELYKDQDRFAEAEPLFKETVQVVREDFGVHQNVTQIAMNSLADTYRDWGRYVDAEPLYRELLEARRKTIGDRHGKTRDSLYELAWALKNLGDFGEAEGHFEELLAIEREDLGERNVHTLSSISGLADTYWRQGRLGEAQTLFQQVLQARRDILGERHEDTLASMHDVALIYEEQGRYDKAEPLYQETLALKRETLGERHPDTLITMNNLGVMYRNLGRYQEAEKVAREALALYRDVLGERHPATLRSLNNVGVIHERRGRYGQAGEIYEEVLRLRTEVLGERHPHTLSSLHYLAHIYVRHTRYADAFSLFDRVFKLRREVLGPRHPGTLQSEFGSVYALMYTGRVDDAVKTLQATAGDRLAVAETLLATTKAAAARSNLLNSQSHFQNYVLSLALRHKRPDTLALAGDVMLHWKQVQGAEAAFVAHLVRTDDNPDVKALGRDILNLRTRLARVAQEESPSENPVAVLEELEAKELALARVSGAFKRRQDIRRASIEQLQTVLPENSGVVEFRQFTPVNNEGGSLGGARFAALLVRPGKPPVLTNAGEVEDVERLLVAIRDDVVPARADKAALELREQLFSAFGDDLETLDKVYIAPDGILNLVPFDRLRMADGRYWDQGQDLRILQASRDVLQMSEPSTQTEGLLVLGGIDFGSGLPATAGDQGPDDTLLAALDQRDLSGVRQELRTVFDAFAPLEGSAIEAALVQRTFQNLRPDMPVTVWTGREASEARLKRLDGLAKPPRVLHIATHGFYLDADGPELRHQLHSGLALAGANQGLAGGDIQGEDGILYSLEAEGLNLEGTELAVLSACDTGKGVIDYSEGVVGMTRALRIAGARQILMTLWPISDKATVAFMEAFYRHWLSAPDGDPAVALKAAKDDFRRHENPLFRKPRIWAPFVLIGA